MTERATHHELRGIVRASLASLGNTPAEIASALVKAGCQGRRGMSTECPITVWLTKAGFVNPSAGLDEVWVEDGYTSGADGLVSVASPPVIRQFVRQYDGNDYPELSIKEEGNPE